MRQEISDPQADYFRLLNEKILNSLHEGMIVLETPDMRIINVNRSFLAAVRLEESQIVGRLCSEVYRQHGRPMLFADLAMLLERTLSTGRISRREYLAGDLGPNPVQLELVVHPLGSAEENTRQILILMRDVTRRKRFEREMKRRVQKLSALNEIHEALQATVQFEEVLHSILVGVTAGIGLGFNRAFILLVDESSERLNGCMALGPTSTHEARLIWQELDRNPKTFSELLRSYHTLPHHQDSPVSRISRQLKISLHEKDHLLVRCLLEKQVFNVVHGEVHGDDKLLIDGGITTILGSDSFVATPLYTTQESIGVLVVDNFITKKPVLFEDLEFLKIIAHHASYAIENARLYQELEQRIRDVENANSDLQEKQMALIEAERLSTIGKMAASVAHEIRNPLVTIGGYARFLLKGMSTHDPRWEDLNVIATEVSRLEFIVNEVLGYARFSKPQMTPCDLNRLVRDTLQSFKHDWISAHGAIDLELSEPLPNVRIDEGQLKQVLINLLMNAFQAMPDGGRVSVSTVSTGDRVGLRVADTGCGIPESMWEKVFSPFFTTKSSGTGLGLNIAAQIIAAHGGDIEFESEEGTGTIFRISLPVADEERQE